MPTVAEYKFKDARKGTMSVPVLNLAFFLIFMATPPKTVLSDSIALYCLFSALLVGGALAFYNWLTGSINLLLIGLYVAIYLIEVSTQGIPAPVMPLSDNMSRGIFAELVVMSLPYAYSALRIAAVIPLINLHVKSRAVRINET